MIIFFSITVLLFITITALIVISIISDPKSSHNLSVLIEGFKDGLRGCGFIFSPPNNSIKKYQWAILEDDIEEVCDECLQKAQYPAMDISEWMKIGLPEPSSENTRCQGKCRCKLIALKSKIKSN